MTQLVQIDLDDRVLLDQVAANMAEAVRRSANWIACRQGCTECCMGPFPITQLDARRLRQGLDALAAIDPVRAAAVRSRVEDYVRMAGPIYTEALPPELDELPCPALDPATGTCDLYAARPLTCRTFGPITRVGDDILGPCELCYEGASDEQMIACAVEADPNGLENTLVSALEGQGISGTTIVAFALSVT